MMFVYALQDRVAASGKNVAVYVCHPGAARTSLISTSGGWGSRIMFGLMSLSPIVLSAEKGAYPEVMCTTEHGLAGRALYGPVGRMEWVGPVGRGTPEPYAHDKPVMVRLWERAEKDTGFSRSL
ncbi:hypothetical protein [Brevirhabdus sp.]|uniref:hypothetical protein n=1 Tax=Brevirhabdus sp. TaxID=2004514 RepID=UPI0040599DEA